MFGTYENSDVVAPTPAIVRLLASTPNPYKWAQPGESASSPTYIPAGSRR